jgi:hypothetical protein
MTIHYRNAHPFSIAVDTGWERADRYLVILYFDLRERRFGPIVRRRNILLEASVFTPIEGVRRKSQRIVKSRSASSDGAGYPIA